MTDPHQLAQEEAAIAAELRRRGETDFMVFVENLRMRGAHGEARFGDVLADFQRECFKDLAPNLEALQRGDKPEWRRWWIERTKKASKDTDIAICLVWLIAYVKRPFLAQVCAANSDQAGIIEDRARDILYYNPWLNEHVEIVQKQLRAAEPDRKEIVRCDIESTGTAGAAQGPTPDILVLNELTHVDKWAVMEAHMNNADGVPRGIVIVSTNAGIKGTKAHVWKKNALEFRNKRWRVHLWGERSPWLSEEDMEDARRRDPVGLEFARLWKGLWVSGKGDAVDEASIDASFCLPGPLSAPEPGWSYIAGLDLGISHDHAGVVLVGVNRKELLVKVARIQCFEPSIQGGGKNLEVNIAAVEAFAEKLAKAFRVEFFGYDPAAGGSFTAQRLRARGIRMVQVSFSPKNLDEMARGFVILMKGRRLKSYEDPDGHLRRDYGKFTISYRPPSNYRLEAVSDEFGHADVGTALVICLPRAVEMLGGFEALSPDDDIVTGFGTEADLTEEEIEALPAEFRDLYGMYSHLQEEWDEEDLDFSHMPLSDMVRRALSSNIPLDL